MGAGWHHGLMTPQQRTALMLHGFTGTPGSIEPWARRFRQQGWSVCTPTLAGHGTTCLLYTSDAADDIALV